MCIRDRFGQGEAMSKIPLKLTKISLYRNPFFCVFWQKLSPKVLWVGHLAQRLLGFFQSVSDTTFINYDIHSVWKRQKSSEEVSHSGIDTNWTFGLMSLKIESNKKFGGRKGKLWIYFWDFTKCEWKRDIKTIEIYRWRPCQRIFDLQCLISNSRYKCFLKITSLK